MNEIVLSETTITSTEKCENEFCGIPPSPSTVEKIKKFEVIIPDGYLDQLFTNKGSSVGSLNEKHKILLLFMRHTKCCFCKEAIHDLCDNYTALLQLNSLPILVHQESNAHFDKFLEQFDNPIIKNMLHLQDKDNAVGNVFGITDFSHRNRDIPIMLYRVISLKLLKNWDNSLFPEDGASATRMPALFILEKGKIVHQFRHLHYADRPDYLRVLIDPDFNGTVSDIEATTVDSLSKDGIFTQIPKVMARSTAASERTEKSISNQRRDSSLVAHEKMNKKCIFRSMKSNIDPTLDNFSEMEQVLKHPVSRRYFHLFASKEFSAENVLFWQEANRYSRLTDKNMKREKAESIIDAFFDTNALLGINISNVSKKNVLTRLNEEGPVDDLFEEIVQDLQAGVLWDTYNRFKDSELFKDMRKTMRKYKQ
jgi:hypothetical protein